MVKSLSSNFRGEGSIPGWGLRSHTLHHVAKTNKETKPNPISESIMWNKGLTAAKEPEGRVKMGKGAGLKQTSASEPLKTHCGRAMDTQL